MCAIILCAIILCGTLLANGAGAAPGDNLSLVRDLAGAMGPIIGSALACPNIARPRVQLIIDRFQVVIREASSDEADRADRGSHREAARAHEKIVAEVVRLVGEIKTGWDQIVETR